MSGPAPKPAALKKLAGNPGRRKINDGPGFSGDVKAPSHLNKVAKAEWNRVVKELKSLDMLRSVDSSALAAYCQSYSRWSQAEKQIEQEGIVVYEPIVNKTGDIVGQKMRKHPAVSVSQSSLALMLRSSALFGFSPAERTRIQVQEKQQTDPFETFMATIGADITHDETED